jgi:hypothetical protein
MRHINPLKSITWEFPPCDNGGTIYTWLSFPDLDHSPALRHLCLERQLQTSGLEAAFMQRIRMPRIQDHLQRWSNAHDQCGMPEARFAIADARFPAS